MLYIYEKNKLDILKANQTFRTYDIYIYIYEQVTHCIKYLCAKHAAVFYIYIYFCSEITHANWYKDTFNQARPFRSFCFSEGLKSQKTPS